MSADKSIDRIRTGLAHWYAQEKHRYDFRESRNPYRTWITEIFLQQTQIAAGRTKLKTFLKRFPDVKSLARGPIDDVLTAFQGMGYYSRARNMHRAAGYIVEKYRAQVPVGYSELIKVPGIGHYTAAIVASIHGGEKILALDANHARVLARLFRISYPVASARFRVAATRAAAPLFEGETPAGDVNEALMQWGQTICKKNPLCDKCFAAAECGAKAAEEVRDFPQKGMRPEALEILWLMFVHRKQSKYQVVENNGSVSGAPLPGSRAASRDSNREKFPFLKGEWMFPSVLALPRGEEIKQYSLPGKIPAAFIRKFQSRAQSLPVDFKHAITRHKISVKLLIAKEPQAGGKYFTPKELKEKCHSSLMQKALRRLDKLEFD